MKEILQFEALGCDWSIKAEVNKIDQTKDLQKKIKQLAQDFENNFSRFHPQSETRQLSNTTGTFDITPELHHILTLYRQLYRATKGKFTPLIGQTLNDMGYDQAYSLKPKEQISRPPDFIEAIELNLGQISIHTPVQLDFGGLGKGYLIDKIAKILQVHHLKTFLINGSGDIYYQGDASLRAGLEDPKNPKKVIAIADLEQGSLCASSLNRRSWGEYSHIVDPQNLHHKNDNHIIATWVIAKEAAIADAIATSLFFTDPKQLLDQFDFQFLILHQDNKIIRSKGFKLLPPT